MKDKKKIQALLKKQIEYVIKNSSFYRNKLNGKDAEEIYSKFPKIKFTTKKELLEDEEKNPPFGSNLCVSKKDIRRVHKTSGTTNIPLMLALTENDIFNTVKVGAECFRSSGLTEKDIVIHCLNYNMWAGGYTDHQSLEKTGAGVIPFGVGNSHSLIETILLLRPTAIHCTPSYLKKLELILKNDFKLKPKDLKLRLGLFGAESGLQNPLFRKNIEETWGMKAMNANYGLSDVLSIFGSECKYQKGLHFFGEGIIYPELINPQTLETVPIMPDAEGELVLTNLCKEAQPLLRYRTNDIIKVLSVNKCKCGRDSFMFEVIGRSDDMFVVKGVNVFLNAIENIISKYINVLTGVYQIHISKIEPIDKIKLHLEVKKMKNPEDSFCKMLKKTFQQKLSFSPEIILLQEGELPRTESKSKKIFRTL